MPLIGNVLKPLPKSVLLPLGLTAAASEADAAINEKLFGTANTALVISNEKINDIMKIVKWLEESGLLIKGVIKTIKNEAKEQKGEFLGILLGTLGASLPDSLLTSKRVIATNQGRGTIRAVKVHLQLPLLEQVRIFNVDSSFNKFWNWKE